MVARIPTLEDIGQNLPGSSGQPSVRAVQASGIGGITPNLDAGRAWENLGGLVHVETQKLDALLAQDALNQIKQARLDLTMGEGGALTVKGGNVLDSNYSSRYKEQLDAKISGIMDGLSSGQRAKLKPYADGELRGMQSDILRHSMGETERYHGMVRQGTIDTAVSAGIEQWGDPQAFERNLVTVDGVVQAMAREQGIDGTTEGEKGTIEAMRRKAFSPMFVGAITKALDTKTSAGLARAQELFQSGRLAIEPNARLQLGEHLQREADSQSVQGTAQSYTSSVILPANTPAGKFTKAMISSRIDQAESNGIDIKPDGTLTMGPTIQTGMHKGDQAVGRHQLMPKSAEQDAREAGLAWNKELFYAANKEGSDYRDALHSAHVDRLLKLFDRPEEVAAAYNAGEGNVMRAKEAFNHYQELMVMAKNDPTFRPRTPPGYNPADGPISFLDFLPKPKETKPYVKRVMSDFKSAPDVVAPSEREIAAEMSSKYPDRPDLAASATKLVQHTVKQAEDARAKEVEDTKEKLYRMMGQGVTFEQLPPSEVGKLPPKDADAVRGTFDAHLKGTPRDSNTDVMAQINNDPTYLSRLAPSTWNGPMKTMLSEYDWQRLDKQRAAQLGGNIDAVTALDTGTIKHVLDSRLRMLEIDPTPKENNSTDQARINSMRAVIEQSILDEQARVKRKLNPAEVQKHIDTLFSVQGIAKGFWSDTKAPVMTMSYSDIPSATRDKITAELAKKGAANPTETQVLTVYKQMKAGLL